MSGYMDLSLDLKNGGIISNHEYLVFAVLVGTGGRLRSTVSSRSADISDWWKLFKMIGGACNSPVGDVSIREYGKEDETLRRGEDE